MSKTGKVLKIVIFAVFIAVLVFLTIYFWNDITSLRNEEVRTQFVEKIRSMGVGGWFVMLGIQISQIIVAFLPGEPVEIIMGFVFGTFGGLLTCLFGILIGSSFVYILAKYIGKPFISLFINLDELNKYKFLRSKSRVNATIFLLFFIPGTPKDALTYLAPALKIKPWKFILIATFARIPSVITSTIVGDSISQDRWILTIVVFVITAVLAILGILVNNWYMKKQNKQKVIIFDLDGTLLNTVGDLTASVNFVMKMKGYPTRTEVEVQKFLGNGIKKLIERVSPEGSSAEDLKDSYDKFMEYYLENVAVHTYPYPGIIDALTELKKDGYRMAIASNKRDSALQILANKFFKDLIDLPLGVTEIIKPKPSKDMIDCVFKKFDCKNTDIIYFGDSEVDVQTCIKYELECIGVSWGFRSIEQLKNAGATTIIDDPKEIVRIVKEG